MHGASLCNKNSPWQVISWHPAALQCIATPTGGRAVTFASQIFKPYRHHVRQKDGHPVVNNQYARHLVGGTPASESYNVQLMSERFLSYLITLWWHIFCSLAHPAEHYLMQETGELFATSFTGRAKCCKWVMSSQSFLVPHPLFVRTKGWNFPKSKCWQLATIFIQE